MVGMHMAEIMAGKDSSSAESRIWTGCFAGEEVSYADWFTTPRPAYRAISVSPLRPDSQQVEAGLLIARDFTPTCGVGRVARGARRSLPRQSRHDDGAAGGLDRA